MKLTKPRLFLTLALLASLALAGCGGGGGDSTATSPTTTTQTSTTKAKAKAKPDKKSAGNSQDATTPQPSGPAPTSAAPLPNQGTKAVAPGVPTAKGGDNSIQAYGLEADSAERVGVASIAKAYLDAQAAGQWDLACSYLTAQLRAKFEAMAKQAALGSQVKGCAGVMAAFLGKAPKAALRKAADIHVLSLRVKGDQAFVVYRDGTGKPFNLPLVREGDAWKISALAGIGLVL